MIVGTNTHPLLLTSAPPPIIRKTDASFEEIVTLRNAFSGTIVHLHPFTRPKWKVPNAVLGFTRIRTILQAQTTAKVVNVFNPAPYDFPILRFLKKPVIYTITASIDPAIDNRRLAFLNRLDGVIVSNGRDRKKLLDASISNVFEIKPGIDLSTFADAGNGLPLPDGGRLKLLSASAPWSHEQFQTKGITALLDAVAADENLELTVVMRGSFASEARQMVDARGIAERVTILDGFQDMKPLVMAADLVVLMASDPAAIKAWPHSLLEGLAAGKPVITSRQIAMADLVRQSGCGMVVDAVSSAALLEAVEHFRNNREKVISAARFFEWEAFSIDRMLDQYEAVYNSVLRPASS